MKVALVQKNLVVGDFEGNRARLLAGVEEGHRAGAELAVTSELSLCGYPPRDLLERPQFVDACQRALVAFAKETPIPTIVGSIERASDKKSGHHIYNTAVLVADGRVQSVHRKALLPTYDVFDEKRHFDPAGDDSFHLAEHAGKKLGISICEDMWNDPDFWRDRLYARDPIEILAQLGPDLLINISASPFTLAKRELRCRMLSAVAQKHAMPLVFVNQVGGNDDLLFDGHSMVVDATGKVIARAREFEEDVLVVDIESGGEMREHIGESGAVIDALVMGTRDYAHKCGFSSAVIGLSGGIDSTVVAAIAVRALGKGNVLGVSMPSRYSSQHSKDDAQLLADSLGINMLTIPIEPAFGAFSDMLKDAFVGHRVDVTEENLQARSRGVVLMALSNKLGHLLLTTGNKSELAVGYCTLYGDMAGGLAVISDVPKTMVYEIAREFNRQSPGLIADGPITKPPSAELRPEQKDQDTLPAYDILDAILELHIEEQMGASAICAKGFDPAVVDDVVRRVRINEYKRRQMPPGLIVTSKAFGPGRRLPIAHGWRG